MGNDVHVSSLSQIEIFASFDYVDYSGDLGDSPVKSLKIELIDFLEKICLSEL